MLRLLKAWLWWRLDRPQPYHYLRDVPGDVTMRVGYDSRAFMNDLHQWRSIGPLEWTPQDRAQMMTRHTFH